MNDRNLMPSPDVLAQPQDDGSLVLLHQKTRAAYKLNPTGLLVWEALSRKIW